MFPASCCRAKSCVTSATGGDPDAYRVELAKKDGLGAADARIAAFVAGFHKRPAIDDGTDLCDWTSP